MDILLVQVSDKQICTGFGEMPPLGLLYMDACIRKKGYASKVIDLNICAGDLKDHLKIVRKEIIESDSKIVGFSSFTQNYYSFKYLCSKLKKDFPSHIFIYGGCHASFSIKSTMREVPVDIIIKKEGEETILDILDFYLNSKKNLNSILGIAYRDGNEIIENPDRPLIKNLDELPIPDRKNINKNSYRTFGTVMASRGCIGKCSFCSAEAMAGGKYRIRSVENVCEEINFLVDRFGVNEISFLDNTFTVYKNRTLDICSLLKTLGITWDCESRIDVISNELLQSMSESGCIGIQYGIESGDNRVLKDIRKALTVEQVRSVVKLTLESGIKTVFCGFIIGHPTDNLESIKNTFTFARELIEMGAKVGVKISTPFPGTQLEKEVKEKGYHYLTSQWSLYDLNQPIFEIPYMDSKTLYKLYISEMEELNKLMHIRNMPVRR